ncbi:hypothetical protein FHS26_005513 [Rhizobium pisi]|uniref:Uncharacterized protein n=1 Tax=Rhizobium pisi TaxID=574561 RepID=A0A7W5G214_9HYPH|nr:hypothetical protein [Rhizobium pisi]
MLTLLAILAGINAAVEIGLKEHDRLTLAPAGDGAPVGRPAPNVKAARGD